MAQAVSLEALRARIREIEGAAPVHRGRQQTGVAAVDQLVDGFPCPGIVELCGSPGSGRIRLALVLVRERTRARQSVAWVDSLRQLYPPALAAMGSPSHWRASA